MWLGNSWQLLSSSFNRAYLQLLSPLTTGQTQGYYGDVTQVPNKNYNGVTVSKMIKMIKVYQSHPAEIRFSHENHHFQRIFPFEMPIHPGDLPCGLVTGSNSSRLDQCSTHMFSFNQSRCYFNEWILLDIDMSGICLTHTNGIRRS